MAHSRDTSTIYYALTEFAYILLFFALGAAILLFARYSEATEEISTLEEEVNFLQEELARLENGVVPCWRRPDKTIPPLAGFITIHHSTSCSITHTQSGETRTLRSPPEEREEKVLAALLSIFREEQAYAREKNCYVRIAVRNETNDYSLYKGMADILAKTGMVLVHE